MVYLKCILSQKVSWLRLLTVRTGTADCCNRMGGIFCSCSGFYNLISNCVLHAWTVSYHAKVKLFTLLGVSKHMDCHVLVRILKYGSTSKIILLFHACMCFSTHPNLLWCLEINVRWVHIVFFMFNLKME